MNQTAGDGKFWMRSQLSTGCGNITHPVAELGILRYGNSTNLPTTTAQPDINIRCKDEPYESLVPVVPWFVSKRPANDPEENRYEAGVTIPEYKGFHRWALGNRPMWLDYQRPTITNLFDEKYLDNPDIAVVDMNYDDEWAYLIITGRSKNQNERFPAPDAHPMHMHGHDFAILAQLNASFDEETAMKSLKYENPPRRDTALLPLGGYLVVAFRTDNAGAWLVHCQ
ncbi:MAG: hypothetical protein Q9227_008220 [Pyrenula ochraceoflavens]